MPDTPIRRLVILAPNWLGDAVMALPAIEDVRRALPGAVVAVAARPAVAPLFDLVDGVAEVVTLARRSPGRAGGLAGRGYEAAILLPNSLHAAVLAWRAGVPERWGYRTDCRGRLLTRGLERPRGCHQVAYYQQLVAGLGFANGPAQPRLEPPPSALDRANTLLSEAGWDNRSPLVAIAPGAAYGGAKRWPPGRFASLVGELAGGGIGTVMVGTAADRPTADAVVGALRAKGPAPERGRPAMLDLVGRTDLAALAGVLAASRVLVTNDSGAMHLAAAVGTPVTAVFGPTDERATRPVGDAHTIVTHDTWCRPCMLRECPLDHQCMRGIEVAAVLSAARRHL